MKSPDRRGGQGSRGPLVVTTAEGAASQSDNQNAGATRQADESNSREGNTEIRQTRGSATRQEGYTESGGGNEVGTRPKVGGERSGTQFIRSRFFLFWLCSEKYSTALHNIFNIFEKFQKIQYLTQRLAAKIQYVRMYVRTYVHIYEKKKKVEKN